MRPDDPALPPPPAGPPVAPPFRNGDRVRWTEAASHDGYPGRTYTVTGIADEGDNWALHARQAKAKGGRVPSITTRWPKTERPRIELA